MFGEPSRAPILHDLARRYVYGTEHFDRHVCRHDVYKNGGIIPIGEDSAVCLSNARKLWREVMIQVSRLGFSEADFRRYVDRIPNPPLPPHLRGQI